MTLNITGARLDRLHLFLERAEEIRHLYVRSSLEAQGAWMRTVNGSNDSVELAHELTDLHNAYADEWLAELLSVLFGALPAVDDTDSDWEAIGEAADELHRRLVGDGITPTFHPADAPRARRYDYCDGTCTADCGHCKGAGVPAVTG